LLLALVGLHHHAVLLHLLVLTVHLTRARVRVHDDGADGSLTLTTVVHGWWWDDTSTLAWSAVRLVDLDDAVVCHGVDGDGC
jgi:hypothetical protein